MRSIEMLHMKMIETERLLIRPFVEDDRPVAVELLQDFEFMMFSDSGKLDESGAHFRFDQLISQEIIGIGKRAVIYKENCELIGFCGTSNIEVNGKYEIELGYRLTPAYRGLGIATEAAKAVLRECSKPVYAYASSENLKSINVLNKLGFKKIGKLVIAGKLNDLFKSM